MRRDVVSKELSPWIILYLRERRNFVTVFNLSYANVQKTFSGGTVQLMTSGSRSDSVGQILPSMSFPFTWRMGGRLARGAVINVSVISFLTYCRCPNTHQQSLLPPSLISHGMLLVLLLALSSLKHLLNFREVCLNPSNFGQPQLCS